MRFIRKFIESKIGELEFELSLSYIVFNIPKTNYTFNYKIKDLLKLFRNKKNQTILSENLSYLNDYGIQYKDYIELFILNFPENIEFVHDSFVIDFDFQIDNIKFNFSPPSDLFNFLMDFRYKGIYEEIDEKGFDEKYFTLKILNSKDVDFLDYAHQAVYFINSDLIIKSDNVFYLTKLNSTKITKKGLDLLDQEIVDVIDLNRFAEGKKYLKKQIVPVKLFNYSLLQEFYNKYLYLYKILEYYASLNRLKKIELMRSDINVDTATLIDYIKNGNEERLLSNLLEDYIPPDDLQRFKYIIANCKALEEMKIFSLSKIIYSYRNSIVHSKEEKINKSIIPDIFPSDQVLENMNTLIENVVELVIENFID